MVVAFISGSLAGFVVGVAITVLIFLIQPWERDEH